MYATDFEKKLNLLIRDIRNGLSQIEAENGLEEVLKYAIFEREKKMAREKFAEAIGSKCIAV